MNRFKSSCAVACTALGVAGLPAWAEDQGESPAAAPTSAAMTQPAMSGPLAANPNPTSFDGGPLGKVYVTGVASGFAQVQSEHVPGDKYGQADVSNGQVIVQTTEGLLQFYAQAGIYSLPSLGTPYLRATKTVDNFYGALPVAFLKIAPNDSISVQAGKLPTLIGAEYTFTFENFNINRGLLWNQENAINQGVQGNYTVGPLALSLAWTDGFYSNRYNWLIGSATYTFDPVNSLAFVGGGNAGSTTTTSVATPLLQNNSQIYNLIYTYNSDPWTVQPYLQYTSVPKNASIGIPHDASTFGGAVLAKYSFSADSGLEGVSLPVRFEYISSSGSTTDGTPNLLYGPGSEAWSITVTPTWQKGIFFARAEASYVGTASTSSGAVFGSSGNSKSQVRGVLEGGVLF
jgi:hypothetical protein